jgi:hypothetical protein
VQRLNLVAFAQSITSSWRYGHAMLWLGHRVVLFERPATVPLNIVPFRAAGEHA